ncbi:MAG TPA: hypothetical protein DHW34_06370 [Actinobacteria bacterium]|nr:hypothetical protein [Actinomycetota bacterium]HCK79624.1 hypothetical protein [Actinomycetota bacterium]
MCQRVTCRSCGKVTYSGCGEHLDQVFAGVPDDQRCRCAEDAPTGATATAGAQSTKRRWPFSRTSASR